MRTLFSPHERARVKNMDYNGEGGHDVAGNNDIPLLYLPKTQVVLHMRLSFSSV